MSPSGGRCACRRTGIASLLGVLVTAIAAVLATALAPVLATVLALFSQGLHAQPVPSGIELTAEEHAMVLTHGPWPVPKRPDASNRWSGHTGAARLGRSLFFDVSLSPDRRFSCASCHVASTAFTEIRARSAGRSLLPRNTPTVVGLAGARWFGWDGGNDSLWAQSIRPMVASDEMNATADDLRRTIAGSPRLSCEFEQAFERGPARMGDDELLVTVGKALAAYQEGLTFGRSAFDQFRDALASGDEQAMDAYPPAARRGLKLFVGHGRCSLCHFGPAFTNGEFDSVGIVHFLGKGKVDKGRFGGIEHLRATPFNRLGRFNDDPQRAPGTATRHVGAHPRTFGQFKVPSLRNVAQTAPYMHAGSHPSLESVVRHYNDIDVERLHADGALILRPLGLSASDAAALVAFLRSLSGPVHDATAAQPANCLESR
ncbi:MAG: cytochrome c peroxidase [Gammaproteobacteria bacterium]|jgi:cytochrome c peroxidase